MALSPNYRAPNVSIRGSSLRKNSQATFKAQIDEWVNKTKARMDLVPKLATFRLSQVMQTTVYEGGNLPYRHGYLRASLKVTFNSDAPRANRLKSNSTTIYNEDATRMAIFGTPPGATIRLSYTMNYARILEYTGKHAGYVMRSVQRWPTIFHAAVQEAKGMIK
jgi:hypothetical protein